MEDQDRPALTDDPRAALAAVIHDAFKAAAPEAYVGLLELGEDGDGEETWPATTTIDGNFDLLAVADHVLSHMPESK